MNAPPLGPLGQWLRDAPREERRRGAAAAAVVLALLAWAMVPITHNARTTGANVSAGDGRSANPNAAGQPDAAIADQTAGSGGPGASTVSRPGGAAVSGGGPATAATPGTACSSLTASDQGITPTEVHVGVTDLDVGDPSVSQQFGFRYDTKDVVNALVDDINSRGGVACRKLVVHFYEVNAFDENDQGAKCQRAAHDDHMFAVLDPGVFTTLATQSCVTVQNHVPLLTATAWPASYVQAQAPYYLSPNTDANRAVRNWVFLAKQAGLFDPAPPNSFRKLGLLVCKNDGGIASEIKRDLAAVGVTSIKENTLSCQANLVAPPNQVTQFAVDDAQQGVTHVFPATLSTNIQVYLKAAASQLFKPHYSASDAYALTAPGFTEDFDPAQWNGTVGYTSSRSGELRNGSPSPETVRCDAVLRAHSVKGGGIQTEWDDFPRVYCDLLHLFTVGMNRVPPNPTRREFSQAVQTSGRLGFSGASDGIYDRLGKFTGADFVRTIQWRDDNLPACDKGDSREKQHQSTGCWFVLDPTFQPNR